MFFYSERSSLTRKVMNSADFVFDSIENIKAKIKIHGPYSFSCRGMRSNLVALQLAVRNAKFEVAELLISEGAPLNCQDSSGQTLLHDAVCAGYLELLPRLLPAYNYNVDIEDSFGYTPLYLAVWELHFSRSGISSKNNNKITDTIKWLFEHGADIHHRNKEGKSVYDLLITPQQDVLDSRPDPLIQKEVLALWNDWNNYITPRLFTLCLLSNSPQIRPGNIIKKTPHVEIHHRPLILIMQFLVLTKYAPNCYGVNLPVSVSQLFNFFEQVKVTGDEEKDEANKKLALSYLK